MHDILRRTTPGTGYRLAVVGGCGGMGQALVAAAVALGIDVTILDLERSCKQVAAQASVTLIPCDIASEAQVQQAFREIEGHWGGLDGLVNLAGYTGERIPVEDMPTPEWQGILDASLNGMFYVARAAAPLLRRSAAAGRTPGAVLVSSTFGVKVTHSGYAPYAVSKAGVINLVRALGTEWAPAIRVNGLAPGVIDTAFLRGGTGREPKASGIDLQKFEAGVPLGRLGQADEIAWPILFLLSDAASYVTGQTLHVNGGSWMA